MSKITITETYGCKKNGTPVNEKQPVGKQWVCKWLPRNIYKNHFKKSSGRPYSQKKMDCKEYVAKKFQNEWIMEVIVDLNPADLLMKKSTDLFLESISGHVFCILCIPLQISSLNRALQKF